MRWLLVATLCMTWHASVSARSIEIDRFDARIEVGADGRVQVEERLAVSFRGSWNGIFREIPYGYTYPGGIRGKIRLTVDSVQELDGGALQYTEQRIRGRLRLKIRVPGAKDSRRTVVIRYVAEDVVRAVDGASAEFGRHDELYWNVTGNDWQIPIRAVTATVVLPRSVPSDEIRRVAYSGRRGATEEHYSVVDEGGHELRIESTRALEAGDGLTLAVAFPPGHVARPSIFVRGVWLLSANWYLALPLGLLLLWYLIWRSRGRDSLGDRTIVPSWEAPMGLRPTEIGTLVDDRMDQRDLTASIFDLAVRGVIHIEEQGDAEGRPREFKLLLQEHALDGAELESFEEALVDALFGGKSEILLKDLRREFFARTPAIARKVSDDLVVKGLLRARPDRVRQIWMLLTTAALVGQIVFGGLLRAPLAYWIALSLLSPLMMLLAWRMPQRTKLGLDVLARIRGMEEYLATAERDRLEHVSLHQIEKLLPYAICLDLHDRWTGAFSALFEQAPQWYRSQRNWSPGLLTSAVTDMNSSVRANLYSVPRSRASAGSGGWGGGYSGGGGFSGGSSGGGFGGGGGGGW